jgi:hypothetical protein
MENTPKCVFFFNIVPGSVVTVDTIVDGEEEEQTPTQTAWPLKLDKRKMGLFQLIAAAVIAKENQKLGDGKKSKVEKDGMGVSLVVPSGEGLTGMSEGVLRALESKKLVVGRTRLALGRRIIRADASLAAVVEAVRAVGEESVTTSSGESVTTDWSEYGTRALPLQVVIEGCAVNIPLMVDAKPMTVQTVFKARCYDLQMKELLLKAVNERKNARENGWVNYEVDLKGRGLAGGLTSYWDIHERCLKNGAIHLYPPTDVSLVVDGRKDFWLSGRRGDRANVAPEQQHGPAHYKVVKFFLLADEEMWKDFPWKDMFDGTTSRFDFPANAGTLTNMVGRTDLTILQGVRCLGPEEGTLLSALDRGNRLDYETTFVHVRKW